MNVRGVIVTAMLVGVLGACLGWMSATLWQSDGAVSSPAPGIESSTEPESATEQTSVHELLGYINSCVEEQYPELRGVGGNKLRFDSMEIEPYGEQFNAKGPQYAPIEPVVSRFRVRIHEEHPHQSIPNGAYFTVSIDGECGHLIRD